VLRLLPNERDSMCQQPLSEQGVTMYTCYRNTFSAVLAVSVCGNCVFHWAATHSSRYWPQTIGFLFPPLSQISHPASLWVNTL